VRNSGRDRGNWENSEEEEEKRKNGGGRRTVYGGGVLSFRNIRNIVRQRGCLVSFKKIHSVTSNV
jgi:hypothetical protein